MSSEVTEARRSSSCCSDTESPAARSSARPAPSYTQIVASRPSVARTIRCACSWDWTKPQVTSASSIIHMSWSSDEVS